MAGMSSKRSNWRSAPDTEPIARTERAALSQRSCARCHGVAGKGDGPLAARVGPVPPRDLTLGNRRFFVRDSPSPAIDFARTIEFGMAGTSMPSHDLLSDSEVLSLAPYVESLKQTTNPKAHENPCC